MVDRAEASLLAVEFESRRMSSFQPLSLIKPRRKITGMSAVLLPFDDMGQVDWSAFAALVARTAEAGLMPAVNMDTGYVNLIDERTQDEILRQTRQTLGDRPFVAGAFVADQPSDRFQLDRYLARTTTIQSFGGTPILFQSFGLTQGAGDQVIERYQQIAQICDRFLGFELTTDLARFGAIYDLETFKGLMSIRQCVGLKHSSFQRQPEWERLQVRDEHRPDFCLLTGNDFAIDMVMYGSDYLLGLSTFAPELFALRDRYWAEGDARFHELNDQLQYLGRFAFRQPSAGYKHSAAQFLNLRGWISSDRTHPFSVHRPKSDVEVLREIGQTLDVLPRD